MQTNEDLIKRIAENVALRLIRIYANGGGGSFTMPLAADGVRGGVQIGFTTDATARKYAVQLDNEKAYVNVPWTDHYAWSDISGKPNFATVATSGSYSDLSNKPSIPSVSGSVSGSTLTITINGTDYSLTDTNTWRPVQNTLDSTSTSDSLSAYQGYLLARGDARDNTKLPLAGGTMTGTLKVATGYGISDASDNGLLCYHPTDWTGVTSSQWGVGAIDCEGVIRSSNNALKHYRYNDGTYEIIDSKGGQTIANSLQVASVKIEQTNEVNSYQGAFHLNYRVASDVTACIGGGNFGIGTTSPGHKLHVVGRIYCTGGFAFLSDIRKKDVIEKDLHISVGDIAKAPLIKYTLKGDEKKEIHIGSVAQYWQNVMPETINKSNDGTLSMDYGTISLVSVVTLARKLETMEKELSDIKKKLITK